MNLEKKKLGVLFEGDKQGISQMRHAAFVSRLQKERAEKYKYISNEFFFKNYVIYFWLHWVFVAAHRLSLLEVSGVYSSLQCTGFSLWWLLLLPSTDSRCAGFSSCGTWAQQLWLVGSRAQAQQLWRMGLVAPPHVRSSRTRARTRVPCIGRQTPNHCATRETL